MADDHGAPLLNGLQALRDQAAALTARLTAGTRPTDRYSGEDPHGLVLVTVDGQGRATNVRVEPNWRNMSDPSGLQHAVVAAIAAADSARLEGWATAEAATVPGLSDPRDEPRHAQPAALLNPVPAGTTAFDGVSSADSIRALLPLLDAAERQLDELRRRSDERFSAENALTSPDGAVSVRAQGGVVTSVQFRASWITRAASGELAQQLCQLLQDAYDRTWDARGDGLPDELSALAALTADPEQMLRQLGLSS